ncbi:serine-rich adhesin for platelets-like isoform X2 [Prorops nasuta]|uniref:serine-rich adhesin for platelets-like isoform X2 n=1 Tax=Prorops nasuta TaxID=863751 RepID=UPI0034CDAA2A
MYEKKSINKNYNHDTSCQQSSYKIERVTEIDQSHFLNIKVSKESIERRKNCWNKYFDKYTKKILDDTTLNIDTLLPVEINNMEQQDIEQSDVEQEDVEQHCLPMRKSPSSVQHWIDTGYLPTNTVLHSSEYSGTGSSLSESVLSFVSSPFINKSSGRNISKSLNVFDSSSDSSVDTAAYILSNANVTKSIDTIAIMEGAKCQADVSTPSKYLVNRNNKLNSPGKSVYDNCYEISKHKSLECKQSKCLNSDLKESGINNRIVPMNDKICNSSSQEAISKEVVEQGFELEKELQGICNEQKSNHSSENSTFFTIFKPAELHIKTQLSKRKKLYTTRDSPVDLLSVKCKTNSPQKSRESLHPALHVYNSILSDTPKRKSKVNSKQIFMDSKKYVRRTNEGNEKLKANNKLRNEANMSAKLNTEINNEAFTECMETYTTNLSVNNSFSISTETEGRVPFNRNESVESSNAAIDCKGSYKGRSDGQGIRNTSIVKNCPVEVHESVGTNSVEDIAPVNLSLDESDANASTNDRYGHTINLSKEKLNKSTSSSRKRKSKSVHSKGVVTIGSQKDSNNSTIVSNSILSETMIRKLFHKNKSNLLLSNDESNYADLMNSLMSIRKKSDKSGKSRKEKTLDISIENYEKLKAKKDGVFNSVNNKESVLSLIDSDDDLSRDKISIKSKKLKTNTAGQSKHSINILPNQVLSNTLESAKNTSDRNSNLKRDSEILLFQTCLSDLESSSDDSNSTKLDNRTLTNHEEALSDLNLKKSKRDNSSQISLTADSGMLQSFDRREVSTLCKKRNSSNELVLSKTIEKKNKRTSSDTSLENTYIFQTKLSDSDSD